MQLIFSDPLCNFSIEEVEEQDAEEVNGAPRDGDGQALTQGTLVLITHVAEGNIHGHPVDNDADDADQDGQGQHHCNGQPRDNQPWKSGKKKTN